MVVCNRHMWAFRLADGTSPDVPTLRAVTFEVRVEGDEIRVRLPDGKP
jgi:nitrite reductase/ring-hydroxylating ferredoxin subunit